MRSMATPNDHMDMKNRMNATPLATQPIVCHISIRSIARSFGRKICRSGDGYSSVRYCNVNCTVTVMMTGTGTPLSRVGVNSHWRTASSAA